MLLGKRIVSVGDVAFKSADCHRFAFNAAYALHFALGFLRADTAAYCRKGAGAGDDLIRFFKFALGYVSDKFRDGNAYGTAGNTGAIFAVKTALSLVDGLLFGIAESNFFKILVTYVRILNRHGVFNG